MAEAKALKAEQWTQHKAFNQRMQSALGGTLINKEARDLSACASALMLELLDDGATRPRPFSSCRRRWCPICEWRKSMKRYGLMRERLPALVEANQPLVFLMLTVTIRNVQLDLLPKAVDDMLKAFRRLTRRKEWPAVGFVRSLEVTYPRPGEAHPHIHVMLAVRPSYFKRGYISKARWAELWKESMALDYDPVVDIRSAKSKDEYDLPKSMPLEVRQAVSCALEVVKYATKPADVVKAMERGELAGIIETMAALKRKRMVECGGIMRGLFGPEDRDEAQDDEPESTRSGPVFHWRAGEKVYRRFAGE